MGNEAGRLADIATRLHRERIEADDDAASPWLAPLQRWQAQRLAITFADLLDRPDTSAAASFFLDEMYGEQDVTWRDRDVLRMLPTMQRWLPDAVLGTVASAIELDWLSFSLDRAMAAALVAQGRKPGSALSVAAYGQAYRAVGRREDRARQIDLLVDVGRDLDRIVRMPLVYMVLKLSRGAAGAAGLRQLQAFLERGFASFRQLGGADEFLATIASRERQAMKRLLAGDAAPFGAGMPASFGRS